MEAVSNKQLTSVRSTTGRSV